MRRVHTKRRPDAPMGFFESEAAGLRWLDAADGVAVVEVLQVEPGRIDLAALDLQRPTAEHAGAFGAALAATHDAGADGWGAPPSGYDGPTFIGNQPMATRPGGWPTWGAFYAEQRVLPYARLAAERGHIGGRDLEVVQRACDRLVAGGLDDGDAPARLHGDLWNGNVQWTGEGAVVIDPAAHGGHRETDLAMLALFGCPHLARVYAGYDAAHPLRTGWEARIPLHQLHPIAVHAASHGAAYAEPLVSAAHATLALPAA